MSPLDESWNANDEYIIICNNENFPNYYVRLTKMKVSNLKLKCLNFQFFTQQILFYTMYYLSLIHICWRSKTRPTVTLSTATCLWARKCLCGWNPPSRTAYRASRNGRRWRDAAISSTRSWTSSKATTRIRRVWSPVECATWPRRAAVCRYSSLARREEVTKYFLH